MGTSFWVRRRGFNSTKNPRELGFKSASKKATISATIAPRSGFDRASIVVLGHRRSLADRWETNPRQNLLDRGSIAPQSRLDHAAIVKFFHAVPPPSDRALTGWTIAIALIPCAAIVRRIYCWPSDGDPAV